MKALQSLFFLFITAGLLISCTDNDKPWNPESSGDFNTLTLTFDGNSTDIPVNKIITFTATGNDGHDYTDQVSLSINGDPIDGNTYTFEDEGVFDVQASYDNITSNTLSFNVLQGRVLRINRHSLLKQQVATFTLYDVIEEADATAEGTFYVNNSAIEGNTFSSSAPGDYEVYAEYEGEDGETETTDTLSISVVVPTQRALIEDYTGTWCGYCPRLQSTISDLMEMTDDAVVIALHASSSDVNPDPYEYEKIDLLIDEYNPYNEFPTGRIDRTFTWNDNDPSTALEYIGGESPIGIEATTTVNGSQLKVAVRIASTEGLNGKKIVVAAMENHLFHDQTNYLNTDPDSEWYQMGDPIPDYENDHVMRHAMTNVFGDAIPETNALEDFEESYSMDMSNYYEDQNNAEVAIFVLDDEGTVLQVKGMGMNETVGFE